MDIKPVRQITSFSFTPIWCTGGDQLNPPLTDPLFICSLIDCFTSFPVDTREPARERNPKEPNETHDKIKFYNLQQGYFEVTQTDLFSVSSHPWSQVL